ncbi:hypothetical protein [Halorussus caseinilyticus]|uniref:Uncharacterized protein n=1 Tax=Halorussus caseinilyticus TaxID=3034025 RepID=A0ABD5WLX1_9EURY|nr:hypothetical protein [Halorussus sp. DT72]
MGGDEIRIRVRCRDCSFEKVVSVDADETPADVLIEHGQRTGHTLSLDRISE